MRHPLPFIIIIIFRTRTLEISHNAMRSIQPFALNLNKSQALLGWLSREICIKITFFLSLRNRPFPNGAAAAALSCERDRCD
jgi:hypothetical protein